jgi:hypothetical protein
MASNAANRTGDRENLVRELLLAGSDREEIGRRIGYASPPRMSTVVDAAMRHRGLADTIDQRGALHES